MVRYVALSWRFKKDITLVCKCVGIWDGIVNPIYGCMVRMAQGINPIYAGLKGLVLGIPKM